MGTFLGNRWDIDYTAKRVYRDVAVTPTVSDTSLALYSALQDLFDEPDQMDDPVPMSAQTPTAFTWINQWFIDDESTQYLTGGAMSTVGWAAGEIRAISYDGSAAGTAFATTDIGKTIVGGTTGDTGTILAFDERIKRVHSLVNACFEPSGGRLKQCTLAVLECIHVKLGVAQVIFVGEA